MMRKVFFFIILFQIRIKTDSRLHVLCNFIYRTTYRIDGCLMMLIIYIVKFFQVINRWMINCYLFYLQLPVHVYK